MEAGYSEEHRVREQVYFLMKTVCKFNVFQMKKQLFFFYSCLFWVELSPPNDIIEVPNL